jgi:hypothetical protein
MSYNSSDCVDYMGIYKYPIALLYLLKANDIFVSYVRSIVLWIYNT